MINILKKQNPKVIASSLIIGLASMVTALPTLATSERESSQCKVAGQKAFKVMLSYQSSDHDGTGNKKVDSIANVDWDRDLLSSGLWLLAIQVNQANSVDEMFAVSEKFQALVEEKCLDKKLGPLQEYVSKLATKELVLDEQSLHQESHEILPMLKLITQKLAEVESENTKLRAMIKVLEAEIGNSNTSFSKSALSNKNAESILAEIASIQTEIATLERKVRIADALERTTSELDERLLFAEQDLDAITMFRQETNRKLNQLQEQIRTLQYSE